MSLKRTLAAFVNVVMEEAGRNSEFRKKIEDVLNIQSVNPDRLPKVINQRKGGRRAPAVLDPVEIGRQGELMLRSKLESLDLQRLLDIVAQYGMDPGKLVMKWKDRGRIIDRIVEVALGRATKGDAFRKD